MSRASSRAQVVLVVGASSGIGRAVAAILASRGHCVYGSARSAGRVDAPGVHGLSLDVSDSASVEQAVTRISATQGRLDAVVYSAGFYIAGSAEDTDDELAAAQFDVYFFGAHRLTRAVLPTMRRQGHGRLLYMSSAAAVAAIPFHALYSSTKAALEHYVEALRYEVEPLGIQLACVQGTGVRTDAAAHARLIPSTVDAYEPTRSRALAGFMRTQTHGPEPTAYATTIAKALEAHRMRSRYRVGMRARLLPYLKALAPEQRFRRAYLEFFAGSAPSAPPPGRLPRGDA